MQSTATVRLAQSKMPLLGQCDLRNIRVAAARILTLRCAAPFLSRNLTRAELQLLVACAAICAVVVGEYGEDAEGDSVGDLELRASPDLPVAHQPRLGENGK